MKSVIIIFFLTLILFEGISSLYIKKFSDPLMHAWQILKPDSSLGWFQEPDLSEDFYGHRIETDKQGFRRGQTPYEMEKFDYLVLGPSSAFGWGVSQGETYADLLGQTASVFNASQIGFSSYQGVLLWQKFFKNKVARNIIIAYGVNDLDYFRFYDNQSELDDVNYFKVNRPVPEGFKFLLQFNSGLLLYRAYLEKGAVKECGFNYVPKRRVSFVNLKENILLLKRLNSQSRIILVNTPFSLPDGYLEKLSGSLNSEDLAALPKENVALKDLSNWLYSSAKSLAEVGECAKSKRSYFLAKRYEPFRIQNDISELNQVLLNPGQAVFHVDIQSELQAYLKKGEKVFFDPVHPNKLGHEIIFKKIKETLEAADAR